MVSSPRLYRSQRGQLTKWNVVVTPNDPDRATAMFRDNKLRLLMTLAGFERLGIDDEPGATWIIPSALSARELHETYECIDRHRRDPVTQYGEDGDAVNAEDMLRRKANTAAKQKRGEFDDDSDGSGIIDDGEEDFAFPPGGPVDDKAKRKDAMKDLKKKRRRRRHPAGSDTEDEGLDNAAIEAKRKARLKADLEKRRKIKSKEFVEDSDDDSIADAEFFREEEVRKGQGARVMEALRAGKVEKQMEGLQSVAKGEAKRKGEALKGGREKRKKPWSAALEESSDDVMSLGDAASSSPVAKRALSVTSGDEATDTPLSSPHSASLPSKDLVRLSPDAIGQKVKVVTLLSRPTDKEDTSMHASDVGADSDEDQVVQRSSGRRKQRAIVLDESD